MRYGPGPSEKPAEPAQTRASQFINWGRTTEESTSCSQKGKGRETKSMAIFPNQDLTAAGWGKALLSADPRSSTPKVSALAAVLPEAEMLDL